MQDGNPTRRRSYMQDGTPTRHSSYYATDHQHHQGCVHGLDLKLNSFPDKDVPHWGYICGTCCQDVAAPAYLQERPWTDSLVLKTGNIANCLLARCLTSGNLVVFESSALSALPYGQLHAVHTCDRSFASAYSLICLLRLQPLTPVVLSPCA